VPFESLGAVSYSPSIVTMAASVAVCELSSVKERLMRWCQTGAAYSRTERISALQCKNAEAIFAQLPLS